MVKKSRTGLMVGLALVAGVAVGAVGMLSLRGGDGPYATVPPPSTRGMGAAPATTAFVTAVSGNCEMPPVLASAGDGDGQEQLQAKPGAASADEVASLILSGKEAAASGHRRDAEIDFLNACRNAVALQGGDPIPLADAMYQLARHYATVAAFGQGNGKELYPRAARLYSASLEAYRARYGEDSEKTRFAREGLVTVQQATGGKPPTAIAKTAPPPAAPVAAAPASAPVAAASAPAPVAAASAPAPVAAASAPAPVAEARRDAGRKETAVAKTEPAPPRPPAVHREARRPAPIVSDDNDNGNDGSRASRREESTAVAAPPARETPPARSTGRRSEPDTQAATDNEPAPRSQARRAPVRTSVEDEGAVAVDAPPPPPRRPRAAPSYSAEPAPLPPPDYGSSGAGPAPAQAEGSPNAQ